MSRTYRYDHQLKKNRKHQNYYIVFTSIVILGILTLLLINSIKQSNLASHSSVDGPSKIVGQATSPGSTQVFKVAQQDYSFSMPVGWTKYSTSGSSSGSGSIITWRSGASDHSTRTLTIYEDTIPKTYALNLLMPVTADGTGLDVGSISTNCYYFTTSTPTSKSEPTPSKWDGVDFLCNTPDSADDQVGTGSVGPNVNSVTITGPKSGSHSYFFLYIDRDGEFDYSIFYAILDSFRVN